MEFVSIEKEVFGNVLSGRALERTFRGGQKYSYYRKGYLTNTKKFLELNTQLTDDEWDEWMMREFGVSAKRYSLRYETFKKSVKCFLCGIEGNVFTLDNNQRRDGKVSAEYGSAYHFNLYHMDLSRNNWVLMTKDHIIPASRGGSNDLDNLQTACVFCNGRKGVSMPDEKVTPSPRLIRAIGG